MVELKRQRIRDPLHNLIEFNEGDSLERMLWRVIKSAPFQRLRRVRQLGFSDLVYPGATHSRFSHSLGVFHTARQLMGIVRRFAPDQPNEHLQREAAMTAALVHDIGHGPFSHAFEPLGVHFGWKLVAEHEDHSEALIRCKEPGGVGEILDSYAEGFSEMVAGVVRGGPASVYRSVVSSQFDADRLDYIRRDRLMCGTHLAAIDFEWLIANLEIGVLPPDAEGIRRQTFVLGPKAVHAAEAFVTGLFQMYPTVYFHKATRGAEKLAQAMLRRTALLAVEGDIAGTGLSENHPLIRLFRDGDSLPALADLDDTVIWGALPMLRQSRDAIVGQFAQRLMSRRLFKAIDLHPMIFDGLSGESESEAEHFYRRRQKAVTDRIEEWVAGAGGDGRILIDTASRKPYKSIEEEGPMNQIWIRDGNDLVDLRDRSPAVAATRTYRAFRAYVSDDDEDARRFVSDAVTDAKKGNP